MGQILHGGATTTHAIRAAIQRSKASIQELTNRYDLNPKTVLSVEQEALAVAFRTHTLLPLDDCLCAASEQPAVDALISASAVLASRDQHAS